MKSNIILKIEADAKVMAAQSDSSVSANAKKMGPKLDAAAQDAGRIAER
jgi:hypothetical protein